MKNLILIISIIGFTNTSLSQSYSEDVTGYGEPTAISEHPGAIPNLAKFAFDNDIDVYGWSNHLASDFPAWLTYDFEDPDSAKTIAAYRLYGSSTQSNGWPSIYNPNSWVFEGSNDGVTWTSLHEVENADFEIDTWHIYETGNTESFQIYRFTFTETEGLEDYVRITEVELLELADTHASIEKIDPSAFNSYPNPADNGLTLNFKNEASKKISLIDLSGKIIFTEYFNGSATQIPTTNFANGHYILKVESQDHVSCERISIQH